jgi:hypothetical protein
MGLRNSSTEQRITGYSRSCHTEQSGGLHRSGGCCIVIILAILAASLMAAPLGTNLQLTDVEAAVDIDVSGSGRAAASDGEQSISTDGDSFCSITDDIAGGRFSSLFEGIVDCDDDSRVLNQLFVEYSFTKNPVKIGDKTQFTITVKDKSTDKPVSDALVSLNIDPYRYEVSRTTDASFAAAVAGAGIASNQQDDKSTQTTYTDDNGRATFTVLLGPKSDTGIYDTEIEVSKDSYQSVLESTNLRVE